MNLDRKAPTMFWRAMATADLPAVKAIADRAHVAYPEDAEVFAERLALFASGCFVLANVGGVLLGYVVSHPWRFAQPPPLNTLLRDIPEHADSYYIHDLALLPEARGAGAASRMVDKLTAFAAGAGFAALSLVAFNHSAAFWRVHGLEPVDAPDIAATLESYGREALFMLRRTGG